MKKFKPLPKPHEKVSRADAKKKKPPSILTRFRKNGWDSKGKWESDGAGDERRV